VLSSFRASTRHTISFAVACLDAEVDEDLSKARTVLKTIQEQCLAVIVLQAQREAVSVLLQVLYFLHQGHVQFLIGDYRARVLDTHGPDAFPKRAPRQGVVCTVHVQDIRSPACNTDQQKSTCPEKTTASLWIPRTQVRLLITPVVAKRTRLTPPSPPPHRRKRRVPRRERRCLLKPPKRLASALTPRHVQSQATMMSPKSALVKRPSRISVCFRWRP
jgi:hypothetical protein